jgi:NAD(P)-dependent dehydrogenase (short-subunit alcohol dehydrogenase family)
VGFPLALRTEVGAQNVGVTAFCPGLVDTPMMDRSGPGWLKVGLARPIVTDHVTGCGRPAGDFIHLWRSRSCCRIVGWIIDPADLSVVSGAGSVAVSRTLSLEPEWLADRPIISSGQIFGFPR